MATYSYDALNRLVGMSSGRSLGYDPLGRLSQTLTTGSNTRMLYDGAQLIAEYNETGGLLRRYIPGGSLDEPLVWYEGAGTADRRWLSTDERGSVVAISNAAGAVVNINTYDEYGAPGGGNQGRFQYSGQVWMPEFGLYHYKSRVYSATLGRFMQPDPTGYADGMNLYAYVGNDPLNFTDPLGLEKEGDNTVEELIVTARKCGFNVICIVGAIEWPWEANVVDLRGPVSLDPGEPEQKEQPKCPMKKPTGDFETEKPSTKDKFRPAMANALSRAFKNLNSRGIKP